MKTIVNVSHLGEPLEVDMTSRDARQILNGTGDLDRILVRKNPFVELIDENTRWIVGTCVATLCLLALLSLFYK
jgi:hypothetical protein